MTFTYLFHLFEIICLNTFLEFLSFVHVTSKLSFLSNHAEHPKGLAPGYTLPPFILKFLAGILLKITSIVKLNKTSKMAAYSWRHYCSYQTGSKKFYN